MKTLGFSLAFITLCTIQAISSNLYIGEEKELDKNQKVSIVNKEIQDLSSILKQLEEKKEVKVPQSLKKHYEKYKEDFMLLHYKLDENPDIDLQKETFSIHQRNNLLLGHFN